MSDPKTQAGRRLFSIDPVTAAALEVWRGPQEQDHQTAGELWRGTDWVFTDDIGRTILLQRVSVRFQTS